MMHKYNLSKWISWLWLYLSHLDKIPTWLMLSVVSTSLLPLIKLSTQKSTQIITRRIKDIINIRSPNIYIYIPVQNFIWAEILISENFIRKKRWFGLKGTVNVIFKWPTLKKKSGMSDSQWYPKNLCLIKNNKDKGILLS